MFRGIHLVRAYLITDFFFLFPLYAPVHIFNDPSIPPVRTYLMDGLFLNQNSNNTIRVSYSLKYKHSEKKWILQEPYLSKDIALDLSHDISH